MTRPGPSHWEWWTPAAGDARARLHYVAAAADPAWYRRVVDTEGAALVTAACGRRTRFVAAGIFSRMSRPRCTRCCARLGVPRGDGTPRNEQSRSARAAAQRRPARGDGGEHDRTARRMDRAALRAPLVVEWRCVGPEGTSEAMTGCGVVLRLPRANAERRWYCCNRCRKRRTLPTEPCARCAEAT